MATINTQPNKNSPILLFSVLKINFWQLLSTDIDTCIYHHHTLRATMVYYDSEIKHLANSKA